MINTTIDIKKFVINTTTDVYRFISIASTLNAHYIYIYVYLFICAVRYNKACDVTSVIETMVLPRVDGFKWDIVSTPT